MSEQPPPPSRATKPSISDSDANELRRLKQEKEAELRRRVAKLEEVVSTLDKGFAEFKSELQAMFRAYAFALTAFGGLLGFGITLLAKVWPH